ncbi:MAG TPA: ribonuclease P protein component [Burkholderiales bacterium]|nr:ribonuclease P protein component [Burkholderiales bacterium]
MKDDAGKLPRGARLDTPAQFTGYFSRRYQGHWYQVLARPNGRPQPARLGLIVGRKVAARAVDRSLARRLAREAFRRKRSPLAGLDVVIRLVARVANTERRAASHELQELLARLGS